MINWTYNESSRQLRLGFDSIVDTTSVNLALISMNYSDGSNANGVTTLSGATVTTSANGTTAVITLTVGQDAAVKEIQRNDPNAKVNMTLAGGSIKDTGGNNVAVNVSQFNSYVKAWHESPSWPSSLSSDLTIPSTTQLQSWGWTNANTQTWNISTVLTAGGLGSNYNVVYYYDAGTNSTKTFSRTDWAGSSLQYVNNPSTLYSINMTGTARFELCCRTI